MLLLAVLLRSTEVLLPTTISLVATSAVLAKLKEFKAICAVTDTHTHTLTDLYPCYCPRAARLANCANLVDITLHLNNT